MCAAEQSSYQVVHCMCALILSSGSELQSSSVFSCAYNLTVSLRATIFLRVLASVCMWMAWLSTNSVCLCSLLCYCIRASKKNTRCNSPKEIMIKKMLGWLWPQIDPFFANISVVSLTGFYETDLEIEMKDTFVIWIFFFWNSLAKK